MLSDELGKAAISLGPFRLLPPARLLERDGAPVEIGSRALDILIVLAARAGEVVSKRDLLARVWSDVTVEEGTLRFHVSMLRKALGDGKSGTRYVINVPGRGYSLVAPISRSIPPKVPKQKAHASDQRQTLPAPLIRMVGRVDSIRKITEQLSAHRFVTVVGPGGIGKTSVATGVAHALLPTFDGHVSFVDLGALSEPQLVSSTVASTLGLMVNSEDSVASLLAFLQDRRMLLVLDNCEHVIETVAILAETIFNAAPSIHILATSRESLRVEGEHVHRLLPLNCPPEAADLSAADVLGFPAPQLFVERAAAASDEFRLTDADAPLVADICRKLDGIPLALELAAARIGVFGIKEMAARLDDRMLVARGRRTAMPRHQTLNATLDWSFEMLSPVEAELLCCLAMFAADFTVEAAISVASQADTDAADIVTNLSNLVEKSLVVTDVGGDVLRYRLLNATRIYASRRLAELDTVAHRHAEYHCELLQRANAEYESVSTSRWAATYRASLSDVRAALDWCFSSNGDHSLGVSLTIAAVPLWTRLSLMPECQRALERALAHDQATCNANPHRRMLLYAALGETLIYTRGQGPEPVEAFGHALAVAEELDDTQHRLQALYGLWNSRATTGPLAEALESARKFQRLAAERSHPAEVSMGDRMIGSTLCFSGEYTPARRHLENMLNSYAPPALLTVSMRHQFDQRIVAKALLARVSWLQGFPDQATTLAAAALESALASGHDNAVCYALVEGACPVALLAGDVIAGRRLVAQLLDRSARHGLTTWHVNGMCLEGELLIKSGEIAAGLSRVRDAIEELNERRFLMRLPVFLGALAWGCALTGRVEEASSAIEHALAWSERTGVQWMLPELLRIKGEVAQLDGDKHGRARAEEDFDQALEQSRLQGSRSWELRAALSLARLWYRDGRVRKARELVRPIYEAFGEGFQTADLQEAKALIDPVALSEAR